MSAASQPNDVKAQFEQTYAREETNPTEENASVDSELSLFPITTTLSCVF